MQPTKPTIVLTRRWPQAVEHALAELGNVRENETDEPFDQSRLVEALVHADVVCPTVTDKLTREVFEQAQRNGGVKTKLLANFGVGFNHIDLAAAEEHQVLVSNTPGVLTDATAELALTLLLMSARRAGEGEREVRDNRWVGWRPTHMLSTQVTGKSLGIVGMGRIGIALARKAHHGLGMQICYSNRSSVPDQIAEEIGARQLSLEELLVQSDFVSLNCPSTPETHHLINADRLALMQPHAHLINTARGDVVDEAALAHALRKGAIAGAGLDVYEQEPKVHAGLMGLENVVLLPHMGSGTVETRYAMGMCAFDNVAAFVNRAPLPNRVGT